MGGKGTGSTQSKKKTQRKQRAGLCAPNSSSNAWLVQEQRHSQGFWDAHRAQEGCLVLQCQPEHVVRVG